MKILRLFVTVLFISVAFSLAANAQDKDICEEPDVMAEYAGGKEALFKYISENVKYPEEAKKEKIQGKVFVQFVIDKTGKVTNAKIARGVGPSLDKEALRVVNAMDKWKPASKDGKPVNVQFTLPINFALE